MPIQCTHALITERVLITQISESEALVQLCLYVLPFACFLEDGHLHRAVRIGAHLSVLEDLALFPEPQPVETMKLYQVSCRYWTIWWGDI